MGDIITLIAISPFVIMAWHVLPSILGVFTVESQAIAKLQAFVQAHFKGDPVLCFDAYSDAGEMNQTDIIQLLTDADIGLRFLRPVYAAAVIAKLDTDHDGYLTWPEVQAGASLLPTG